MEGQSGDHFPHSKQARLIACHGMAAEAAQPGCFLAQMCCMTFSLGCGGSVLLLLLSVSFVQAFLRQLSRAACPSDFHLVMRFIYFFFSWVLVSRLALASSE